MVVFNNIRYRIGVINDFRNSFGFVDYRKFGDVELLDASLVSSAHKGFTTAKDTIGVFLNYKLLKEFRDAKEASAFIDKLISEAPSDSRKSLLEYRYYLV